MYRWRRLTLKRWRIVVYLEVSSLSAAAKAETSALDFDNGGGPLFFLERESASNSFTEY